MSRESALNIVVEGPTDAAILRALLSKAQKENMRFYSAGGRVSLASVARNLLIHEGSPVLVVMDADTYNPSHAEELQDMTRLAMRNIAPSIPSDTFAFMPTIEAVFFETPKALERLLGKKIPQEKLEEGAIAPKQTLAKILGANGSKNKYPEWLSESPQTSVCNLHRGRRHPLSWQPSTQYCPPRRSLEAAPNGSAMSGSRTSKPLDFAGDWAAADPLATT